MAHAPERNLSHEAFEAISARFRVLSDPLRLKILYNLKTGEMSVTQIVESTGGSQSNVSLTSMVTVAAADLHLPLST